MTERNVGVAPDLLDEELLLKELETMHRTRHETLLRGSDDALATHTARMTELENEYLRRHPQRVPMAGRTRAGARRRTAES